MQITQFPSRVDGTGERLAGFMAHLRANGIKAGVSETAAAMNAMQAIDLSSWQETRMALKAICAHNEEQFSRFEELFDAYWRNRGLERQKTVEKQTGSKQDSRKSFSVAQDVASSGREEREADTPVPEDHDDGLNQSGEGRLVGSRIANMEKRDLREFMTPEDLALAGKTAEQIARAIRDRRSRRRIAAKRGRMLDLRRTIRKSVENGGEPFRLLKRNRPDRPVHLVALLDVSGSMTVYARVFLSFLRGLMNADQRTDAFLFHTNLVSISDALRDHDTFRAVNRLSIMAKGFGGGTKIGSSLATFNRQYASRIVNSRTVMIILSDGYDTDPAHRVGEELARLKKRCRKIIWLNPLKGWKDYEPVAAGMASALPHLDMFAAANTLADLAALEPALEGL